MHRPLSVAAMAMAAAILPGAASAAAARPAALDYHVTKTVTLGAPDRWDYVQFDPPSHRVCVARGDRVTVVDGGSGSIVGQIGSFPGGTHGIAIVKATGRGYTDDGRAGTAASFDLVTLKLVKTIQAE